VQPYFVPDLRPLHELKVVTGLLAFGQLPRPEWSFHDEWDLIDSVYDRWLETFEELEALESAGSLTIEKTNAPDLKSLSGLRALTGEGALVVTGANGLRDFEALGQLQGIRSLYADGERLESIADLQLPPTLGALVLGGEQLTELDSVLHVRRVERNLDLSGIPVHDLTSFSALESVGEIHVNGLPFLESLSGLEQLTDAGDGVTLFENPSLDSIDALTWLRHAESLVVEGNTRLRQIPDFPALGPLKVLSIRDNPVLEQIGEFSGILRSVLTPVTDGTTLRIDANSLDTIIRRPDIIRLQDNEALRSFSMPVGWEGGKYVAIYGNDSLETLNFVELEDVDLLGIWYNPKLHSVALGKLANVDSLVVIGNSQLPPSTFDSVQTFKRYTSESGPVPVPVPAP